ncbi:MAG: hypothetical protein KAS47_00200 [Candidatus Heimdallarchaeota archaeon]|nr:hypothetical protein [Candidatus Heimdallarchaeota archaeon]MCK4971735.1 hypothetical protein [Candidatus Heimdallarchaeota archaeon]
MPTIVKYEKGVKLVRKPENLSFVADPTTNSASQSSHATFITHAHTDHSVAFPDAASKVFSTKVASELYEKLTAKKPKNTHYFNFGKTHKVEDIEVKFIPAGHLLGAAQILFYFPDRTICYTGDISTDEMITVPKAAIPDDDIDVLITEATYGTKDLYFDTRERTKISLLKWIAESLQEKRTPVINLGHLGPAQEIIAFLNSMLSVDILCDTRTSRLNQTYKNNNISLNWENFEEIDVSIFEPENTVVLVPRACNNLPSFLDGYKVSRGMVTGQAARFAYRKFDQTFPFSMHANSQELVNYVEKIKPKKVYTLYGFDSELASLIRHQLKIPSRPLKLAEKKPTLDDYLNDSK